MPRSRFDHQLETLNTELITMGALVETTIASAAKALMEGDRTQAKRIAQNDSQIDGMEKSIESLCLKLLLQQQPVARDLRLISAALKMITDMERIGDQAADISELTLLLGDIKTPTVMDSIGDMARATIRMVSSGIDAFVKKDLDLARKVIDMDDEVDDLFVRVKEELIELIRQNGPFCEQAIDLIMVAKYFERIGDHSVNIAEWVVFSITGEHRSSGEGTV
ncbi:MAG TPA: phosphate signaling complex protein PhoU [Candidatus Ventrousia excrementavium]|uniref:Phosphate-specific transport system accessory protein PhoU n=1 Tax=Candidatus Ventrousia excrementavium TaxID=2840961 RepID=A0A9D1IU35_9CLOT|nr:phosphate signaling complex protein PhoU [Candidatus Ventrousia excrementavium]